MSDPEGPPTGGAEERIDLSGLSRLSERPPPPRGENTIRLARGLSILLLAVAAAGLPWYFVTRGGGTTGDQPPPASTGTASPSPSLSPSPTPTPTASLYEVFNLKGCLHIRAEPSTSAAIVDNCVTAGFRLSSDGLSREGGGRLWRHVYDSNVKKWGWAADEYLKPVESSP